MNPISIAENITGNIGSCTNNVVSIVTQQGSFFSDVKNVITNSCTGEVSEYITWAYADWSFVMMFVVGLALIMFPIFLIAAFSS